MWSWFLWLYWENFGSGALRVGLRWCGGDWDVDEGRWREIMQKVLCAKLVVQRLTRLWTVCWHYVLSRLLFGVCAEGRLQLVGSWLGGINLRFVDCQCFFWLDLG